MSTEPRLSQLLNALGKHPELMYAVRESLMRVRYYSTWIPDGDGAFILVTEKGRLLARVEGWEYSHPGFSCGVCDTPEEARRTVLAELRGGGWEPLPLGVGLVLNAKGVSPWYLGQPDGQGMPVWYRTYASGRTAISVTPVHPFEWAILEDDGDDDVKPWYTEAVSLTDAKLRADMALFDGGTGFAPPEWPRV